MFTRKRKAVPKTSLEESPLKLSEYSAGSWLSGVENDQKPGSGVKFNKVTLVPQGNQFVLTAPEEKFDPCDKGSRYAGEKPVLVSHVGNDWKFEVPGFTVICVWYPEFDRRFGEKKMRYEVQVCASMDVLKDLSERTGVPITYPSAKIDHSFLERRARKCSR